MVSVSISTPSQHYLALLGVILCTWWCHRDYVIACDCLTQKSQFVGNFHRVHCCSCLHVICIVVFNKAGYFVRRFVAEIRFFDFSTALNMLVSLTVI